MNLFTLSHLHSQLIEIQIDLRKLILSAVIGYLENCSISLLFHCFLWTFPLMSALLLPFSFCLPPLSCAFPVLGMSGLVYLCEVGLCSPLLLFSNALIEFLLPLMAVPCFPLMPCGLLCVTLYDLGIGLVGLPSQILGICDSIPSFCSAICPFFYPPSVISNVLAKCSGYLSAPCSIICPCLDPLFMLLNCLISSFCFLLPLCPPLCLCLYPTYCFLTPFGLLLDALSECLLAFPSHLCAIGMGIRATTTDLPFRIVRPLALACRGCPCCYPIGGMASTLGDLTMTFWNSCSLTLFQLGIPLRDLLLEGGLRQACEVEGLGNTLKELLSQVEDVVFQELKIPAYFFGLVSSLPYTVGLLNVLCFLPRCLLGLGYYFGGCCCGGWLCCPLGYPPMCLSAFGEEICFAGASLLMGVGDNFGHLWAGLNRICMCSCWSLLCGAPWQTDWGWWANLCEFLEEKANLCRLCKF